MRALSAPSRAPRPWSRGAALALALFGCQRPAGDEAPTDAVATPPGAGAVASAPASASAGPPVASAPASASAGPPVAPLGEADDALVLLAGGDVNLGREAGQRILREPDYDPFEGLAALFGTADYRFVNLESQLSEQGGVTQDPLQRLKFTGPPGGGHTLARAGVELVSLANNHMWDYGKRAFFETLENLERAGVRYVGASATPGQQYEPVVVELKGRRISIFAVTQIWNQPPFHRHAAKDLIAWADFGKLEARLRQARQQSDLVLFSYHGGAEYVGQPMAFTRELVWAVMKTGVDAFIGHHPHVPQGIQFIGGRPVLFSLGNLVFAMHSQHPWTGTSFMARLRHERGRPLALEACPYTIVGHRPQLFQGKGKAAQERHFTQHLRLLSAGPGAPRFGEPGALSCLPVLPPG